MNWENILNDYKERMQREKELGVDKIRSKFNEVIQNLSTSDIENFEDGELPTSLSNIITVDPINGNFVAIEYPDIVIGTIYDIFGKEELKDIIEDIDIIEYYNG